MHVFLKTTSVFATVLLAAIASAQNPVAVTAKVGDPVTLTRGAANATGLQWFKNSQIIPGANSSSYTIPFVTVLDAGVYTRRGSDGVTAPATLTVVDEPLQPFSKAFTAGESGYSCFRIPAMLVTTHGTLVAVADGRISNCDDVPNPIDVVCKRSFDNGQSWSALQTVVNYGSVTNDTDTYPSFGLTNIVRAAAGDAAVLLDRTNGWLWLLYNNCGALDGVRKLKLEMRFSKDDGVSWSPAIDLEAQNPGLRPQVKEYKSSPGIGIQLTYGSKAGRLIFGAYAGTYSTVIYSDDHGATWHRSGVVSQSTGEIQVAETSGGGLLATMRGTVGLGARVFSRSADGGESWGNVTTNTLVLDPDCQASILSFTSTNNSNASRLIHANPANTSARANMTLRVSYDEGVTWSVSNQVYSGVSAYSSLTRLPTGEIGLLFEKDPYGSLTYTRRSISQITGETDSLPAYIIWAGKTFSPSRLMAPAISGPAADPDGDGFSNYAEFIARTDPLRADSGLDLNFERGTNGVTLSFNAVSNLTYTVQASETSGLGGWHKFMDVTALSASGPVEITVSPTNSAQFFRLATPQLP